MLYALLLYSGMIAENFTIKEKSHTLRTYYINSNKSNQILIYNARY